MVWGILLTTNYFSVVIFVYVIYDYLRFSALVSPNPVVCISIINSLNIKNSLARLYSANLKLIGWSYSKYKVRYGYLLQLSRCGIVLCLARETNWIFAGFLGIILL